MNSANPFHQIQLVTKNGKELKSYQWYVAQIRKLGMAQMNGQKMLKSNIGEIVPKINIGEMYLYYYQPKMKDVLPYYDTYPLVFPFRRLPDGFMGLNLHYLPPLLRMKFLTRLLSYATDDNLTETTRLRLTWNVVKNTSKLPEAAPCVKRYLASHIRSRFLRIYPPDWKAAIFLPLENFQKSSQRVIYNDSKDIINA
jgi:hypothetical protein